MSFKTAEEMRQLQEYCANAPLNQASLQVVEEKIEDAALKDHSNLKIYIDELENIGINKSALKKFLEDKEYYVHEEEDCLFVSWLNADLNEEEDNPPPPIIPSFKSASPLISAAYNQQKKKP